MTHNKGGYEGYNIHGSSEFLLERSEFEDEIFPKCLDKTPLLSSESENDFMDNDTLFARNIWAAVMNQARLDIIYGTEIERSSAIYWINRPGDGLNSFLGICNLLGFNPERVKHKMLNPT